MKIVKLSKNILKSIKTSIIRFPQTISISVSCVILLIIISELGHEVSNDVVETLYRITMILALGIPVSLCINIYFERLKNYRKISFYGSYAGGAVLLCLYYFYLLKDFEMISITRYIGFSLILYITFLYLPYIFKKNNFELYVIKVFVRFFTTLLYSVVLFLGLSAILLTIDKLLGVYIKEEIYYYTWLIVVGVFAPTFFLASIPKHNDELLIDDYSYVLKVLILYIVIPLISVYTIILYIYFAKVIITKQWPEGLVSHLVLWYSTISVAILFLISPLLNRITWIRRYMLIFPKAIIPVLTMMFISIGIRINAYGVTESRYFVVALGIWVTLAMLYFSFNRNLKNIVLPISLAVTIFVSIFGPFSSYSISRLSQNNRFEKLLIKNNMLVDGNVVKAIAEVPVEDVRQMSSILRYFDDNHSLRDVMSLPEDFSIEDMEKVLGVKYSDGYYFPVEHFYFNLTDEKDAIDIKGYDYLFDLINSRQVVSNDNGLSVIYDDNSTVLKINRNHELIYSKDLLEFVEKLLEKYDVDQKNHNVALEDMLLIEENEIIKVKILFYYVSGRVDSSRGEIESPRFGLKAFVHVK